MIAALLVPAAAKAAPCTHGALADPIPIGFQDGAFGVPRRACQRSELSFGAGGVAVVDAADFYGNIRLASTIAGSILLEPDLEVFASLELVRFQTVISSLSASELGLGHLSLGVTQELFDLSDAFVSGMLRVTLPTAFGSYENIIPFGIEAALGGSTPLTEDLELHASLGLLFSFAISSGPADPRFGVITTVGSAWRAANWFALVLDLEAAALYRAAFDHLGVGLGFRFAPSDVLAIELALKAPLAGDERALAGARLGLAWSF
jgi:hypothetical protein